MNNQIPDWNDLVYRGNWQEAARNLHTTNNFPEVTGRVCPAPCEASCTLNIDDNPVAIKTIECAIADRAFEQGWIKPEPPSVKTGKKVAIVGSGPAGMACAQQLARAGHDVHVFEKYAKAGGLLRYGIPDFKMEKYHVDRRVAQMEAEGVTFHYGAHVGVNVPAEDLLNGLRRAWCSPAGRRRRATCRSRAASSTASISPWNSCRSRTVASAASRKTTSAPILAGGKHVVVIGGGDTGSDCIGTSIRQGALSVRNFEIMPQPPVNENKMLTWPDWPLKLRTSSSHEEGAERDFAVLTTKFSGENGQREEASLRARGRQDQAHPRHRVRARRRSGAAGDGLRASRARRHDQVARARARPARQRQSRRAVLSELQPEGVCRPATCAAASRWWCGRSAKAARPRTPSTNS